MRVCAWVCVHVVMVCVCELVHVCARGKGTTKVVVMVVRGEK